MVTETMHKEMRACAILHNMCIEDRLSNENGYEAVMPMEYLDVNIVGAAE
jgi:hypothetical protein